MSVRRLLRVAPVVALVFVASGASNPAVRRMFPAFAMFRGGNLARPVLLGHSGVRLETINGRSASDVSQDPLATLYETLVSTSMPLPDHPDSLAVFEVAEFFGPEWMALAKPDGRPTRELRFEEANHFSHIYVMRTGPPIWKDPVVAPGGGDYSLLALSDTGQAILRQLGLRLR